MLVTYVALASIAAAPIATLAVVIQLKSLFRDSRAAKEATKNAEAEAKRNAINDAVKAAVEPLREQLREKTNEWIYERNRADGYEKELRDRGSR